MENIKPKVLILRGLGINSHDELKYCFELAGAEVDFILWNKLIENPNILDNYQGLGLPGGFAMGDSLGAGQSLANRIRNSNFLLKFKEKIEDENFLIYSSCNSLQVMAKLDLFPAKVGTMQNDSGKHETGMWDIKINYENKSVWLKDLKDYKGPIFAPISHGEGKIFLDEENLKIIQDQNIIALTYTQGYICDELKLSRGNVYNPNGSIADIAGLAWNGNLALFPHFERLIRNVQRHDRNRLKEYEINEKGLYLPTHLIFKSAVEEMSEHIV